MNRIEILKASQLQRMDEVMHHQINIDNYRLAIPKAAVDKELKDFVAQLRQLLESSLLEQKKSQIILDVINEQINASTTTKKSKK